MDRLLSLTTDPDRPLGQGRYQSPLRDERLAAWLGIALGLLFTTSFLTGLYSHVHQHPLSWFHVPARPAGLYRFTQGLHIATGIATMPVLLAKLWVVWPRFVSFPPFRSVAALIERVGLLPLVAGGIFMMFSGIANVAQWYPWRFGFPAAHFWVAWVTMGALVAHLGAKWEIARRSVRRAGGAPAPAGDGLSRRGFLVSVGAGAGALTVFTVGETFRPLHRIALLAPRDPTVGPQRRPVNRSAANANVIASATSPDYRLTVVGDIPQPLTFTADELVAMAQHQATLPIACVEGWSYSARWRGVPLVHLLALAGARRTATTSVESLEPNSPYRISVLDHSQTWDRDTMLATHLDGQRLDLDHGYPLRLIAPGRPGELQTKWVTKLVIW